MEGLRDLVSGIVSGTVFPLITDFTSDVGLDMGDPNPAYDPSSGTVAAKAPTLTVKGAMVKYTFKERMDADGKFSSEDRKVLIPGDALPSRPSGASRALINGVWWNVRDIDAAPGDVLWILHLRKA